MVILSENSIERLLRDVAPKVEKLTGWSTNLDSLNIKIIDRNQLWEEGIGRLYANFGVDMKANLKKLSISSKIKGFLFPYVTRGMYEPISETILVVPENFRFGTNESGFSLTLGHELVHRCQFSNNPEFLQKYQSMLKKITSGDVENKDELVRYIQAYMTLTEGDASYVEQQLKKMFYQDAANKASHISNLLFFFFLLNDLGDNGSGLYKKLKQYERGKNIVEETYNLSGRAGINRFYQLSEKRLYERFV